jgi:hypothetical protein
MTVFTPRRFERRSHCEPDTKSFTTARAELFTAEPPKLFAAPSPFGHEQLG